MKIFTWIILITSLVFLTSCAGAKHRAQTEALGGAGTGATGTTTPDSGNLVCSTTISSPTADPLQQMVVDSSLCVSALQAADYVSDENPGLSGISNDLQRMRDLATMAAVDVNRSPEEFAALNSEFTGLAAHIQSVVKGTRYNDIPLIDGSSHLFNYTMFGKPVACFDTADLSVADVVPKVTALYISDITSAQASLNAVQNLVYRLAHVREISGAILNRISLDSAQAQNLLPLASLAPAPSICEPSYIAVYFGLAHIEQIIDATRQTLASFAGINADLSQDGYKAARERSFKEMAIGVENALALSSIDGQTLLSGKSSYMESCFKGKDYDLSIAKLGLTDLSATSQAEALTSIKKLDSAIAIIESVKIDLGISDADTDFAAQSAELTRLQTVQSNKLGDSCTDFNLNLVLIDLSLGKAMEPFQGLSDSNKIHEPMPGNFTTSISALNECMSAMQTADGALQQVTDILNRMATLSAQADTDVISPNERSAYQQEMVALVTELGRIKDATSYNGKTLLSGGPDDLNILLDKTAATCFDMDKFDLNGTINNMGQPSLLSKQDAENSRFAVAMAIQDVAQFRSRAGAYENQFSNGIALMQSILTTIQNGISRGPSTFCANIIGATSDDGTALVYIGLNSVRSVLTRAMDLGHESLKDNYTDADRSNMQIEMKSIVEFINVAVSITTINGEQLIAGDSKTYKALCMSGASFDATINKLGIANLDIGTVAAATTSLVAIQNAIDSIDAQLSTLSALAR